MSSSRHGSLKIKLISDTHLAPVISPFVEARNISEVKSAISPAAEEVLKSFTTRGGGGGSGITPADDRTVLILAGDIGDSSSDPYRRFLIAATSAYTNVILVPGNHEYYTDGSRDMGVVKEHLGRLARDTGVILLDNSEVVIRGYRFIGSTSWPIVPEEQFKVLKRERYGLVTRITKDSHQLDYSDFKRLHDNDVTFLQDAVKNSREPCVVITHYPPSSVMIEDGFEHSPQIALHYNEGLIDLVAKTQGATPLWCCGHCHTSKRYWTRGMNTLLVSNCVEGGNYDPNFVIEL